MADEKVAWAATSGATNAGAVYFTAVSADRTQVRLTLDYEPEGLVERIGDVLDVIDRQAVADLDRFKEFIEQTGSASGGWRGTVEDGDVQAGGASTSGATAGSAAADTGTAGGGLSGGTAGVGLSSGVSDGGATEAGVEGDLVAVGPTGDTRGSVATEAGPARAETSYATRTRASSTAGTRWRWSRRRARGRVPWPTMPRPRVRRARPGRHGRRELVGGRRGLRHGHGAEQRRPGVGCADRQPAECRGRGSGRDSVDRRTGGPDRDDRGDRRSRR